MTKDFDARNERKSRSVCTAMAESADTCKRVLTDRERQILDMWPRFEDGEAVTIGDEFQDCEGGDHTVYGIELHAHRFELVDDDGRRARFDIGERVELPATEVLDADGVPIRVGDTVWIIPECTDAPDEPHKVRCINRWREVLLEFHTEGSTGVKGEYLTHTRPDSWERLEEDAAKNICEYAGANTCEVDDYDCRTCRFYQSYELCKTQMARSIIRRAKKLAGIEVE